MGHYTKPINEYKGLFALSLRQNLPYHLLLNLETNNGDYQKKIK